jgi:hypothetical protein
MTNLVLRCLEYFHSTTKEYFITVVKSTATFVGLENGNFSAEQRNQHLIKQTLLPWTLRPMAGFTLSLVSEVRFLRVFI